MSSIASQPFPGTFTADPVHSSFAFSLRHSGVYNFRGSFSDVTAVLRDGALDGTGRVESISIVTPPQFRASVLGPDFFDAERHPEISFRSTDLRFSEDGRADLRGELTIRGVTRPIVATGHYEAPREGLFGGLNGGLHLHTTVDRRSFGMDWQMPLPRGGDILGWDVELDIDLWLTQ